MNVRFFVSLLFVILLSVCHGSSSTNCVDGNCAPPGAVNVTDLSFFNGKWYTAAVSPALQRMVQAVCPCPTAQFEDRKNNTLLVTLTCDNSTALTRGWMDLVNHTMTDFTFTPRCFGEAPLTCHPPLVNAHIIDQSSRQAVYFWDPCNLNQTSLVVRPTPVDPDTLANVTRALNMTRPLVPLNLTCH